MLRALLVLRFSFPVAAIAAMVVGLVILLLVPLVGKDIKHQNKKRGNSRRWEYGCGYHSLMMEQAWVEALQRMIEQAEKMAANAVMGTRFATSMVMSGTAEIVAHGMAVKVV